MNELERKAMSGDVESQFALGKAYVFGEDGFPQDVNKAIPLLEKAGSKYPHALRILIGISMGAFDKNARDAQRLINCFERLISVHNRIDTMVTLGAILCGDAENNQHIQSIPELASAPYHNPSKGYRLIEEGIRLAEEAEEDPLGFMEYNDAYCAYQYGTTFLSKGSKYFQGEARKKALQMKVSCAKKALDALKAGKGTDIIPKENMAPMIAMQENILRAAIVEAEEANK
ncbi:MAG: hypothetical protein FWB88_06180 [Defluviitaleaceae bacterium]|nr:hypothetical protein [Defluviitaleaceae bacterium]MCL2238598.1 hypothetical protein [Defluviitaleaceae bacterium]